MKLKIDVPKELDVWQPGIRHQLAVSIMPIRQQLRSLVLHFSRDYQRGLAGPIYCCEIVSQSQTGRMYRFVARHSDGLTAVADACTRARRSLVRDRLWSKALRRAGAATATEADPGAPYPLSAAPPDA